MKHLVFEQVEEERDAVIDLADSLWEHPELSLREHRSAEAVATRLTEYGFEVRSGIGGLETAFVAVAGEGSPTVGLLGEYDALPGFSQARSTHETPLEEAGPGHGCGHNLFAAGSLGGAIAIKRCLDEGELDGRIAYFGCPAEEIAVGKVYMAHAGAFDELDAVLSWHPGDLTMPNRGSCLSLDSVRFTFEGTAAHAAAAPEAGRSALDAVQLMNMGVEYMREHVPDDVRVHYTITSGGEAPNVVPPTAGVWYYIRAPKRAEVNPVTEWVSDIAEGAARMTGTEVERELISGTYGTLPNARLADTIATNMREIGEIEYGDEDHRFASELQETLDPARVEQRLRGLPADVHDDVAGWSVYPAPVPATDDGQVGPYSTDTGNVSRIVPLGRFRAATWPVGTAPHTWQATAASGTIGSEGAVYAAKVIAGTAYDLLADADLLTAVHEEFLRSTEGRAYESPLPDRPTPPTDLPL